MANYINTSSTVKLQTIVNLAKARGDINPILNTVPQDTLLALTIATDCMNDIISSPFPFKFNEIMMPQFLTNSYQQDYAGIYPDGTSVTNLNWLERGIVIDINNQSQPKPFRQVEVCRQLPQATGTFWNSATNNPFFDVNYFPNNMLYYGTWGAANTGTSSAGNNPVVGSQYFPQLGAPSMPANPIMQIKDANGNLLVLTGFGIEGSTAPLAPVNSAAGVTASGTGATTVWTVVDPYGMGFRIVPVPSATGVVWQFNLVGQALPIRFTSLQQTIFPIPDQYETNFRQMFMARCYQYSPEPKIAARFKEEYPLALKAMQECRIKSDRELEENVFSPERSIMSGAQSRNTYRGGSWPFNYPLR